jgi:hypothetical protein
MNPHVCAMSFDMMCSICILFSSLQFAFNDGMCVCYSQWPDPAYRVAPPQLPLDSVIEDDERLMFDMDQHLRHCHCDCGHDGYEGSHRHKVSTHLCVF